MNKILSILALALLVVLGACKQDLLKDINDGGWSKECNIEVLQLEGQLGTAVITRDFDDAKIKVYTIKEDIEDISNVEIKNIQLAYKATSSATIGSGLDFTTGSTTITVVSDEGKDLEWIVEMHDFSSDIEGTWYIGEIGMYCDLFTWEDWGWDKTVPIADYLPAVSPEFDNTITFVLMGSDEDGNTLGTYIHDAGPNGEFGDFADASKGWDFNERFRKIPAGEGTWLRDFTRNQIIITSEGGAEYTIDLEILEETEELKFNAAIPYTPEYFDWDNTDYTYEELAHMSNPMWYVLTKNYEPQTGNSISYILLEEQEGDQYINEEEKYVSLTVDMNEISDLSSVEVLDYRISYAATSNIEIGSKLDFSNDFKAKVNVTSESGETAEWTVEITPSYISLEGTWNISGIETSYDFFSWDDWGYWGSLNLLGENALPGLQAEMDNQFVFEVTNKNNNGFAEGTFEHQAGNDGAFGEFTNTAQGWDFNERMRQFPTGSGTWKQDRETNQLILTVGGESVTMDLDYSNSGVTIKAALEDEFDGFSWDEWNSEDEIRQNYQIIAHLSKYINYSIVKAN